MDYHGIAKDDGTFFTEAIGQAFLEYGSRKPLKRLLSDVFGFRHGRKFGKGNESELTTSISPAREDVANGVDVAGVRIRVGYFDIYATVALKARAVEELYRDPSKTLSPEVVVEHKDGELFEWKNEPLQVSRLLDITEWPGELNLTLEGPGGEITKAVHYLLGASWALDKKAPEEILGAIVAVYANKG